MTCLSPSNPCTFSQALKTSCKPTAETPRWRAMGSTHAARAPSCLPRKPLELYLPASTAGIQHHTQTACPRSVAIPTFLLVCSTNSAATQPSPCRDFKGWWLLSERHVGWQCPGCGVRSPGFPARVSSGCGRLAGLAEQVWKDHTF